MMENNNHRYVVHSDVDMPARRTERQDDADRWPFPIMDIGDCFDETDPGDFDRCRGQASLYGYKHNAKFATRLLQGNGVVTCGVCETTWPAGRAFVLRVWRTS